MLLEKLMLRFGSTSMRESAVRSLGRPGQTGAVRLLELALQDQELAVRVAAANALGQVGDRSAVDSLIASFDRTDTSSAIARALGTLRDPRAVEPLIKALQRDDIFDDAALALGRIGDRRAVMPLIEALQDNVRQLSAARALGYIGDSRAVDPLLRVYTKGESSGTPPAPEVFSALESMITSMERIGGKQNIIPIIRVALALSYGATDYIGALAQLDMKWMNTPDARSTVPELVAYAISGPFDGYRGLELLQNIYNNGCRFAKWDDCVRAIKESREARRVAHHLIQCLVRLDWYTACKYADTLDILDPSWHSSSDARSITPAFVNKLSKCSKEERTRMLPLLDAIDPLWVRLLPSEVAEVDVATGGDFGHGSCSS